MFLDEFLNKVDTGKIFSVVFIKRTNNEVRTMVCRRGVKKGVKGVGHSYKPEEKNLLCVYDMQKIEAGSDERGAFRMINLESLVSLKFEGVNYVWDKDLNRFTEA